MKRGALILAIGCIFAAAGCAVTVDVARFHAMTPDTKGKSFSVLPRAEQRGSLEFLQYGRLVAAKLTAHGLRPVSDPNRADLHAFISYSIDGGTAVTETTTSRGVIKEGYWVGTEPNRTWVPEVSGVTGVSSATGFIYRKTFTLEIVDARKSRNGAVFKVFEGTVLNSGKSNSFLAVSNCMIEGLFNEFPGISGRTMSYAIDPGTCMK